MEDMDYEPPCDAGCILCPDVATAKVLAALKLAGWLRKFGSRGPRPHPSQDSKHKAWRAIPINAVGICVLESRRKGVLDTALPSPLSEVWQTFELQWSPGLRLPQYETPAAIEAQLQGHAKTPANCNCSPEHSLSPSPSPAPSPSPSPSPNPRPSSSPSPSPDVVRDSMSESSRMRDRSPPTAANLGTNPGTPRFRYSELFAGIGGFGVALKGLGGHCAFASEIDRSKQETFTANFGGQALHGDICQIPAEDIPDHDLLTGGFPCESFSKANVAAAGFQEERGTMFWQIVRVLRSKHPRAFLLENVPGLLAHDREAPKYTASKEWLAIQAKRLEDGLPGDPVAPAQSACAPADGTFGVIQRKLQDLGYQVHSAVLDARPVVPQKRNRLYIVGIRQDVPGAGGFTFPTLPDQNPHVQSILEPQVDSRYGLSDEKWANVLRSAERNRQTHKKLVRLDGYAGTLRKNYLHGYTMHTEFVPQDGGNPRFLTPRECARLMGFPDTFILHPTDGHAYQHFGSAVVCPVVQPIAAQILEVLERGHSQGSEACLPPHKRRCTDSNSQQ